MSRRVMLVSFAASVASLVIGVVSVYAAGRPPRLPNLTGYFAGQHPKVRYVTGGGLRFACFDFVGRDGVLSECFAVARVKSVAKPKPSGPAA